MNNSPQDSDKLVKESSVSIKYYISLIRTNLTLFSTISLIFIVATILYVLQKENIYKSTVNLKITRNQENIFQQSDDYSPVNELDRFVANEIDIMESYDTRERVANALIDSINNSNDKDIFSFLMSEEDTNISDLKKKNQINKALESLVNIKQKNGMDIVQIEAFSSSPIEAALIAQVYADQYIKLNLELNRNELTVVREFLKGQTSEKLKELQQIEDELKSFKEQGGIIELDAQSTALINQIAQIEAKRDATKIDLMTSNEMLSQYKEDLQQQDPKLVEYLENQSSQTYINVLQKQIAELQVKADVAIANKNSNLNISNTVKEYNEKISELKKKLNNKINEITSSSFASSPEQINNLSQKLMEEEIRNQTYGIKLNQLQMILKDYEIAFGRIPKKSIELAQLERQRASLKQLYQLVEQQYQETLINELSQPGNVLVVSKARIPLEPSKPNRLKIILMGIFGGIGFAFAVIIIKNYFDDTIKSPSDIQNKNISLLSWIPKFDRKEILANKIPEFIMAENPNSSYGEAFRALRARIHYSKINRKKIKTILVTSSAEKEGKTVVALNLAGSYARANKKVLLIDCDLRKPRIHKVFGLDKSPGLVNYLFNETSLQQIICNTSLLDNMYYINSGSLATDPAEIIESEAMKNFLETVKNMFDIIILDSAPIMAVIDSEILTKMVDVTILVASAEKTETKLMLEAIELIKSNTSSFLGVVLNNFKYRNGYSYYYKYYYNYSSIKRKS